MNIFKQSVKTALSLVGLDIRRSSNRRKNVPVEFTNEEKDLFSYVKEKNLSMASDERLFTTMMACKHALERGIEGDFVECGVWRGGNALLAAGIFKLHGSTQKVYLFDTFEGMTEPTIHDKETQTDKKAVSEFNENQKTPGQHWYFALIEEVKNNFSRAKLLRDNIIFVKGDVLKTLDNGSNLPSRISVLRLDTDWYESTKKELEVLYPKVGLGGVLIIDDYGHWSGARKATDEYFHKYGKRPFLQYTDYTGRVGVKFD